MNLFLRAMCVLSFFFFASGPLVAQSVRAFVPRAFKTPFKVPVRPVIQVPSFVSVPPAKVISMHLDVQKAISSSVLKPGIMTHLSNWHIKDLPGGITQISIPQKYLLLADSCPRITALKDCIYRNLPRPKVSLPSGLCK